MTDGPYNPQTNGDTLRIALAFALSKVRVARHRLSLSEEARYRVADDTIRELRRYGGWKALDEPIPEAPAGLTGSGQNSNDKRKPWRSPDV